MIRQHVNRYDDGNHNIYDPVYDVHGNRVNRRDEIGSKILQRIQQSRNGVVGGFFQTGNVQAWKMFFQNIQQIVNVIDGSWYVIDQLDDAVGHLGNNTEDGNGDKSQKDDVRDGNGQELPKLQAADMTYFFKKLHHFAHSRDTG